MADVRERQQVLPANRHPRLGGELPLFADRLGERNALARNEIAFSHGRAALAWLIEAKRPKSALVCAYTCPSVPTFLRRMGLRLSFFDIGAGLDELVTSCPRAGGPHLVLLPALFGSPPWLDAGKLAETLGRSAIVVIDAAQSAFGHRDFAPPPGGATLSCPRKTTALADGAILALGRGLAAGRGTERLPLAAEPLALKHAARALWAAGNPDLEAQALEFNRASEDIWPDSPHRMSDESRLLFEHLDAEWYRTTRRRNRKMLASALASAVPVWVDHTGTPFSLPVFVRKADGVIMALRKQRIFATRLWPDAEHDPAKHPAAAYMARHLVSLPVDQRYSKTDMARIAEAAFAAANRPSGKPPAILNHMFVS